jgi:hypothetical protein
MWLNSCIEDRRGEELLSNREMAQEVVHKRAGFSLLNRDEQNHS